ncbi:hypothetical protein [Lichenicoccus sp.]|uniref:hypothetical protein n=1 Tax=Lichenicoccus sp. TaxID=2781899 RepID=UPI003D0F5499
MLFMSYTPRPDSDARGYEDWLRATDNPFFNDQPAIAHYSNWKLVDGAGAQNGFTHFDFMFLRTGASPGDLFGTPEVQQFVGGWTRHWGREPDGPPEHNCACCLLTLAGEPKPDWANMVVLSLDAPALEGETWHLEADLIGQAPFQRLGRRFIQPGAAPGIGLRAELIAAP